MLINSFERKNFTPKNAVSKGILLRLSRHQPVTRATIVPIPAPDPNNYYKRFFHPIPPYHYVNS